MSVFGWGPFKSMTYHKKQSDGVWKSLTPFLTFYHFNGYIITPFSGQIDSLHAAIWQPKIIKYYRSRTDGWMMMTFLKWCSWMEIYTISHVDRLQQILGPRTQNGHVKLSRTVKWLAPHTIWYSGDIKIHIYTAENTCFKQIY